MEQQQDAAAAQQPDKVVPLGAVGEIDIDFSHGLARVELKAAVPGDLGVKGGAFVEGDAVQLVTKLFEAIEKKSPPGVVPIEEGVKLIILQAVKAIP